MWWRLLIAVFLVLHGIVFSFLDLESWLVDDGRGVFIALGIVSLAQLLLFFEPGLFVGVGIDLAILAVIVWTYRGEGERRKVAGVSPV